MIIQDIYKIFQQHSSVQTDTRKLQEGDLYFALKGPHFNGNEFAIRALDAGAAYAVVDEMPSNDTIDLANLSIYNLRERLLLVDDVLTTLQQLAKHHRQQLDIPFIAITGSNGKTTSKELIYAVLASHFKTYTTQGNLNNHIGVPLTILSVQPDAEMAVIEMGANHQKEIESYCAYTLPSHGIITNCGKAHLEGFGGVEGVRKGKGELYQFLREHKGTAFVYADYDYLQPMSAGIENIIYYGLTKGLVQGEIKASEPFLTVRITAGLGPDALLIQSQLVGEYNLPNILCAATIGKYFGVPDYKIIEAIESYAPSNSRSQLIERGNNKVILDAYNANPSSMKVAIENFAKLNAGRKIVMLGGMMELGEDSIAEHQALVKQLVELGFKEVVLVGGDFVHTKDLFPNKETAYYTYLPTASDASEWLKELNPQHAYILVKGSRSMKMEQVLQ
ncbi:UDP-N-acetylmuramoyl-tripeptide--D-alanyl-D-alanine ligase [Sediminibacterium sp.]|uniref:UDP-N-acetylmuramoyl-tripeptide--D-alanyl-D- alanine ligase n=1 Tax=Sediminibacterium sp. TaxID=1917865 RepID=UPI002730DE1E|nr:UDP-N-acetylmuramoyl-tripeptide--D-alanyl-D-alanine ligase [Sediminibacterium sp.]MDP1973638.1 UDP-N-acetylmuramoyl-tripeptide--D-alanyl-D-alanine ligase [Sediminibacterium sp.]MDP2420209.1 UDP-N-acetylmuramoyl-tripeptide--D-alanyl-D-alanine ligase [Sediminibacterium sp.]